MINHLTNHHLWGEVVMRSWKFTQIYPELRTLVLMTPFRFLKFQSSLNRFFCVPNSRRFWSELVHVSPSNFYETSPPKNNNEVLSRKWRLFFWFHLLWEKIRRSSRRQMTDLSSLPLNMSKVQRPDFLSCSKGWCIDPIDESWWSVDVPSTLW